MLFRIIALLALLPTLALAQIEDQPAGSGLNGVQFLCARNDGAATSQTDANADWGGCVVDEMGRIITVSGFVGGAGDFGASMPVAPLFVVADAAEALSTTTVIVATSHVARVNDYVEMTAGTAANIGVWRRVSAVATNSITVATAFPATVAAADAFNIHRPRLDTSVYAEDSAHVSTNLGQLSLAVRNTGMATLADTTLDYTPIGTGGMGNPLVSLVWDSTLNGTNTAVFIEDSSLTTTANAGLKIFFQRQDTPTADAGDGDAQFPKSNSVGAVYTDPSHGILLGTATAEIAGTSLTTSYANLLVNTAKLRRCIYVNGTDVAVSFDDSTNPIIERLPAGQIFVDEYGTNGRWLATTIRVKEVTNATSGQVGVNCYS